jgi:hypothetical protein
VNPTRKLIRRCAAGFRVSRHGGIIKRPQSGTLAMPPTCFAHESLQPIQKSLIPTSFGREIMPSIHKIEQEIFTVEQRNAISSNRTESGLVILTFPLRYYFQGK